MGTVARDPKIKDKDKIIQTLELCKTLINYYNNELINKEDNIKMLNE